MAIKIGSVIPDISLSSSEGKLVSLSDFRGKKVVLYFFPKSDTPGCTKESCSLRDAYAAFQQEEVVIVGVSYDTPQELAQFKNKYHLPFILLSDAQKALAKICGAYHFLWHRIMPKRMTIILDEQGKVIHIIDSVDVTTHTQDILALLARS